MLMCQEGSVTDGGLDDDAPSCVHTHTALLTWLVLNRPPDREDAGETGLPAAAVGGWPWSAARRPRLLLHWRPDGADVVMSDVLMTSGDGAAAAEQKLRADESPAL